MTAAILAVAPESATRISVGKAPGHHSFKQDEINGLLVHLGSQGHHVDAAEGRRPIHFRPRLRGNRGAGGGGHHLVGRAGITATQGCAASAGVSLTHRGLARSVPITGHCRADEPLDLDWASWPIDDALVFTWDTPQPLKYQGIDRSRLVKGPPALYAVRHDAAGEAVLTRLDRLVVGFAAGRPRDRC